MSSFLGYDEAVNARNSMQRDVMERRNFLAHQARDRITDITGDLAQQTTEAATEKREEQIGMGLAALNPSSMFEVSSSSAVGIFTGVECLSFERVAQRISWVASHLLLVCVRDVSVLPINIHLGVKVANASTHVVLEWYRILGSSFGLI